MLSASTAFVGLYDFLLPSPLRLEKCILQVLSDWRFLLQNGLVPVKETWARASGGSVQAQSSKKFQGFEHDSWLHREQTLGHQVVIKKSKRRSA